MSDSEDDFMSDKFLVEASASTSAAQIRDQKTYTQRRHAEQLKSLRRGQAKNTPSLAQLEKERRAQGLNRSLFEDHTNDNGNSNGNGNGRDTGGAGPVDGPRPSRRTTGGNKAMEMMLKMGWKVGEGLGKRSASPPSKREGDGDEQSGKEVDGDEDEDAPRGGIGSSARTGTQTRVKGRAEPIRVSLWAGRKGLTARSPSPPPLPLPTSSNRNPDALDPSKLARLGERTDDFRAFQRKQFASKEMERKEGKARDMLVKLDEDRDVKFHPLHVMPSNPLGTLPKALARRIYPDHVGPSSPSPEPLGVPVGDSSVGGTGRYVSEAERTRERMRRDMLSDLPKDGDGDGDEGEDDSGVVIGRKRKLGLEGEAIGGKLVEEEKDYGDVDWDEMVSGTKRVLAMDSETHLRFLLSQLRNEHLFCLWCGYKYSSFEEMDGAGGCPGEDEDDH